MEVMAPSFDLQSKEMRRQLFENLYKDAFPMVSRFVSIHQGSFQDAKDIFQDALVIYYEKLNEGLQIQTTDTAYVLGIAKHLWIRKFNREKELVSLDDYEAAIVIPIDYYPSIETNKLLALLHQAGKKCMDLLKAFYYDKQSTDEVVKNFDYSSHHSATVQKFKCLEKMRDTVKEKSMHYEDFTE
jgi:DNA-directed RNA polymerase specialized sigma24 family protein